MDDEAKAGELERAKWAKQYGPDRSRRNLLKTAYVAPLILTLKATPAFATQGSAKEHPEHGDGRIEREIKS